MHRILVSSLALAGLVWMGCAPTSDPLPEGEDSSERSASAKGSGSCAVPDGGDTCGEQASNGSCWCDDKCAEYGDCCSDMEATCGGGEPDPSLCMTNSQCGAGQICDHSECMSGCKDGGICPAVCYGQCVEAPPPAQCGGFAGLPCPGGKVCIDDPGDDCDPNNGGADCGGICVDEVIPCGDNVCTGGTYCCNASCGICVPKGMFCTQQACSPEPAANSCEGHCGGAAEDKSCYCDDQCEQLGDCCADFSATCG
jgi:hypothetical protein